MLQEAGLEVHVFNLAEVPLLRLDVAASSVLYVMNSERVGVLAGVVAGLGLVQ